MKKGDKFKIRKPIPRLGLKAGSVGTIIRPLPAGTKAVWEVGFKMPDGETELSVLYHEQLSPVRKKGKRCQRGSP